jgi:anti-sigma factor RsiW
MDCNQVQEMVARGESLGSDERAHAAVCVACRAVVESWGQLDALLQGDPAGTVPDGFADRVMAAIADEPTRVAPLRWFERRWVQLGLVQVGALVSLFNLFRFVLRVLYPSLSLGGSP